MMEHSIYHTALDVAKWFLRRNSKEVVCSEADDLSNMKVQKLLYYAQGVCLAVTSRPLFADDILAWQHGPVVRAVYDVFKVHGRNGIEYTVELVPQEEYTNQENDILEQVYSHFGQFSAWKLRNMTHAETPWRTTEKNDVIDNGVIADYFRANYV